MARASHQPPGGRHNSFHRDERLERPIENDTWPNDRVFFFLSFFSFFYKDVVKSLGLQLTKPRQKAIRTHYRRVAGFSDPILSPPLLAMANLESHQVAESQAFNDQSGWRTASRRQWLLEREGGDG